MNKSTSSSTAKAGYPDRRMLLQLRRRQRSNDDNINEGKGRTLSNGIRQLEARTDSKHVQNGNHGNVNNASNDTDDDDSSSDDTNYFKTAIQDALGRDSLERYDYLFESTRSGRRQLGNSEVSQEGDGEEDVNLLQEILSSTSTSSLDPSTGESEDEVNQTRKVSASSSRRSGISLVRRRIHETMPTKTKTPVSSSSGRRAQLQQQRQTRSVEKLAAKSLMTPSPSKRSVVPHTIPASVTTGSAGSHRTSTEDEWIDKVEVASQGHDTIMQDQIEAFHQRRKQRKQSFGRTQQQPQQRSLSAPPQKKDRIERQQLSSSKQTLEDSGTSPTSTVTTSTAATSTTYPPQHSHQHQIKPLLDSTSTRDLSNTTEMWSSLVSTPHVTNHFNDSTGSKVWAASASSGRQSNLEQVKQRRQEEEPQQTTEAKELSALKGRQGLQPKTNPDVKDDKVSIRPAPSDHSQVEEAAAKTPSPSTPSAQKVLAITTVTPTAPPTYSEQQQMKEKERLQMLLDYEVERRMETEAQRAALQWEVEDLKRRSGVTTTDISSNGTKTRRPVAPENSSLLGFESRLPMLSPRRELMQQVTQAFGSSLDVGPGSQGTPHDVASPNKTNDTSRITSEGEKAVEDNNKEKVVMKNIQSQSNSKWWHDQPSDDERFRQTVAICEELASELEALELKYATDRQKWQEEMNHVQEQIQTRVDTAIEEHQKESSVSWQRKLDEACQKCKDVESEREGLESKLQEAETRHSEDLRTFEAQYEQDKAERQAQQELLARTEKERDNLRTQLQEVETQHEKETKQWRCQVEQATAARDDLQSQLQTIESQSQNSQVLDELQVRLDKAISERDEVRSQLEDHIAHELKVLESAATERDGLKKSLATLESQHSLERAKWQAILDIAESERDDWIGKFEDQNMKFDIQVNNGNNNGDLVEEWHDASDEHLSPELLTTKLQSLETERRKERADWRAKLKIASEQRVEAQAELQAFRNQYDRLMGDFRELEATHKKETQEWQSLLDTSLVESPTNKKCGESLDSSVSSNVSALQDRLELVENQLHEVKREHANDQRDWHHSLQELMATSFADENSDCTGLRGSQNENSQTPTTEWKLQVERKRTDLLEKHCKSMEAKHAQEIDEWKDQVEIQLKRFEREEAKCQQLTQQVSTLQDQLELLESTKAGQTEGDLLCEYAVSNDIIVLEEKLKNPVVDDALESFDMDESPVQPDSTEFSFDLDTVIDEMKEDCKHWNILLEEVREGEGNPILATSPKIDQAMAAELTPFTERELRKTSLDPESDSVFQPTRNTAGGTPFHAIGIPEGFCCSALIDQTITILRRVAGAGDSRHEQAVGGEGVIDQLENLSVLMKRSEKGNERVLQTTGENKNQELRLVLKEGTESPFSTNSMSNEIVPLHQGEDFPVESSFPWVHLVRELQRKCEFLDEDRFEVARIANEMVEMERETHVLQVNAAVATARREAAEELAAYKQQTNIQIHNLYTCLCPQCQNRIMGAE